MRFLSGCLALCAVAGAANAAAICASPQEMKVLQAAALQQQLVSAAQSCHLAEDFQHFVAAYRNALVQSDQALRAFFHRRQNTEGYQAYKTRIAKDAVAKSFSDPKFCDSARAVFDVALKGGNAEPPSLIETGYEGCRPVTAAPKLTVAAAKPDPLALAHRAPEPVPMPSLSPAALKALSLAHPAPTPRPAAPANAVARAAPVPTANPHVAHAGVLASWRAAMAALDKPASAPQPVLAKAPKPVAAPLAAAARIAEAESPKPAAVTVTHAAATAPKPVHSTAPTSIADHMPPQNERARNETPPSDSVDEDGGWYDHRVARTDDRWNAEPRWNSASQARNWHDDDGASDEDASEDHIPNAYRSGSTWVRDAGWDTRPRRMRRPHLVMGPDGRMYVVVGGNTQWVRD